VAAVSRPSVLVTDGAAQWPVSDVKAVARVQERLRDLGIYEGPADGQAHEQVVSALQQFQAARGLPQTGTIDPPTADALGLTFDEVKGVRPPPAPRRPAKAPAPSAKPAPPAPLPPAAGLPGEPPQQAAPPTPGGSPTPGV
jgi:peptidoglycan hydrolase-like protein with peptidoglycan-binding domain